ncbi:MAG: IgGFc-binding protein, partial [Tannerella sp.]|nr:IgGFc-binding protein [Tannerella sp.]
MKRIFTVITTTLCLLYGNASYAQIDTRGTDFWLSFGDNAAIFGPAALDNLHLQIRLVADAPATGTITFTESGEVVPFSVGASSVTTFPLTPAQRTAAYQSYNGAANPPPVTSNKSVRVQSDVPISVYALNQYQALAEATGIYPAPTLGTDYYHLGRRSNLTFASNSHYDMYYIVATQNGTDIFENGVQVATNLSAGQVYCKPATFQADLTGRHVTSNNPV